MATISQELTATPSIAQSAVVITSRSSIDINASADKTFSIVLDSDNYKEWNTWCPQFTFPDGQSFAVGSTPTMLFKMEAQKREYHVPVEVSSNEPTNTGEMRHTWVSSVNLPRYLLSRRV